MNQEDDYLEYCRVSTPSLGPDRPIATRRHPRSFRSSIIDVGVWPHESMGNARPLPGVDPAPGRRLDEFEAPPR